jgi:uronate dehydrogenase
VAFRNFGGNLRRGITIGILANLLGIQGWRVRLSIWVKPEDLAQLVRIWLEHPDIHFEIFYGVSDNAASFWDNSRAAHFGYRPQGRAKDFRQQVLAAQAKLTPDPIGARYQGGAFCSAEYGADRRR